MRASLRPVLPILIGASVLMTLSMGIRQSLGLFMTPLTRDVAISVSDFTLAIAVQNLAWGFLQPVTGALAVRIGFRPILLVGAALFAGGLCVLAAANGIVMVMLGAGVMLGAALACIAAAMALSVASRAAPPERRSFVLGVVSAAGSLGSFLAAPIGQTMSVEFGWRAGILAFVVLCLGLLPAAWYAGRVDRIVEPRGAGPQFGDTSFGVALKTALSRPAFLVMAGAYFVCGLQLVFLTTHLPSYLAICGMDPMLSAQTLGTIGLFNMMGSLFFGWAGGRWSKPGLLGMIYVLRSIALGFYFAVPPTPAATLVFAAVMGFLWLGVAPLIAGAVVEMFGLRWQAMIQGLAFMSHQVGSFIGAFGGGLIFDAMGSYDLAWRLAVAMGLTAGVLQMLFALRGTSPPRLVAT
ncbi:putative MFS family arabinose efflux permease [Stella humosa]|uniref:Putative MFS family arabinose efflux permease n=1 Tax=Stella humosa TaxID=94 RepID=A0A3N1LCK7_9PROT|nr:MFS transporter [Stella humosa]ROP90771.1 putative MFS family arabinose efflux permease [Stella humosa]BBK34883.1 MFS transporter [Stella humosa]